jgi:hypothetical protein
MNKNLKLSIGLATLSLISNTIDGHTTFFSGYFGCLAFLLLIFSAICFAIFLKDINYNK